MVRSSLAELWARFPERQLERFRESSGWATLAGAGRWDLAQTVGLAVDSNRREVELNEAERHAVLAVLEQCPERLITLRDALRSREVVRSGGIGV